VCPPVFSACGLGPGCGEAQEGGSRGVRLPGAWSTSVVSAGEGIKSWGGAGLRYWALPIWRLLLLLLSEWVLLVILLPPLLLLAVSVHLQRILLQLILQQRRLLLCLLLLSCVLRRALLLYPLLPCLVRVLSLEGLPRLQSTQGLCLRLPCAFLLKALECRARLCSAKGAAPPLVPPRMVPAPAPPSWSIARGQPPGISRERPSLGEEGAGRPGLTAGGACRLAGWAAFPGATPVQSS